MPPQLSLQKQSIQDILDAFVIGPEEIKIKDKRYPSRIEVKNIRAKLMENLMGLPCFDRRLHPINWGSLLYEEDKYKAYKVKEHNDAEKEKALTAAKDEAENDEAANALTLETQSVKDIYEPNLITERSEEAQLPTF